MIFLGSESQVPDSDSKRITWFRRLDWRLCLLILTPVLLLLANQTWFFSWSGYTNDWVNYLYFLDYFHLPSMYFDDYRSTRLAWILKGWVFNELFSPEVAYYSLNLSVVYVYTIVFYFLTKLLFNRNIAFLTGVMLFTFSALLSASQFRWNYFLHDTIANALITLLLLLLATRRPHWKWYLFFAGMAYASAVQALYFAIYGLSVLFWFVYLNSQASQKRPLLLSVGIFTMGGVCITLGYCIIHYLAGGPFFFFIKGIPGTSTFPQPAFPDKFHLVDKGLVFPTVAIILSIIALFSLKKKINHPYRKSILLILISFLLCIPIAIIFQCLGVPTLAMSHFTLGFYPFLFLAIAAIFAIYLPVPVQTHLTLNATVERIMVLAAFILIVGGLIFGYYIVYLRAFYLNLDKIISTTLLVQISLLVLAFFLLWKKKHYKRYALSFVVSLAAIVFTPIFHHSICYISLWILLLYSFYRIRKENIPLASWIQWTAAIFFMAIFYLAFTYDSSKQLNIISAQETANLFNDPYFWIVASCIFFGPFIICLCIFQNNIKKYSAMIWLSSLFVLINLDSSYTYIPSYLPGFEISIKDQFLTILKGLSIIRKETVNSIALYWYKDSEPFIDKKDHASAIFLGANQLTIYMTAIYDSINAANSAYFLSNINQSNPTYFNTTLRMLPNFTYIKSILPEKWTQQYANKTLSFLFLMLDDFKFCNVKSPSDPRKISFSYCPTGDAVSYLIQKPFKLVMLTHDLNDVQKGEYWLKKHGYSSSNKHSYFVHHGPISYYIIVEEIKQPFFTHRAT